MGRDPIGESGGLNLYGFCRNNSVNRWDLLGMADEGMFTGGYWDPVFGWVTHTDYPVFNYTLGTTPSAFMNSGSSSVSDNGGASAWNIASNAVAFVGGGIQMAAGGLLLATGAGAPVGAFLLANGGASVTAAVVNGLSMYTGDTSTPFVGNSGIVGFSTSMYQIATDSSNASVSAGAAVADLILGVAVTGVPFTSVPNLLANAVDDAANLAGAAVRIGPNIGPNLANPAMTQFAITQTLQTFQPLVSTGVNAVGAVNLGTSVGDIGLSLFTYWTGPTPNVFMGPQLPATGPAIPVITVPGLDPNPVH